jgi:hypothetical protein
VEIEVMGVVTAKVFFAKLLIRRVITLPLFQVDKDGILGLIGLHHIVTQLNDTWHELTIYPNINYPYAYSPPRCIISKNQTIRECGWNYRSRNAKSYSKLWG